jgi:imidazolonepropionase-like amidohydrolase
MADLRVYAAMQPTHFYSDPDIDAALGLERLQRLMPWQRLQKANVPVSFGSDWCAGPINPVYGLLVAGTRMNYKEETDWGPEEALSVEDGIRNWTIGSARALFWEKEIGSIEVGKFADFVLFGEDITQAATISFFLTHDIELGKLDDFVAGVKDGHASAVAAGSIFHYTPITPNMAKERMKEAGIPVRIQNPEYVA